MLLQKLDDLKPLSDRLHSDFQERSLWNQRVFDYANRYLESIENNRAFNPYTDAEIDQADFSIKNEAADIEDLIEQIKTQIDQPGLSPASGGHLAYIPGGGIYPTALGDYLAAVFNKYAGIYYAGPGAVKLENALIRWMCELVGFPPDSLGNLTSGGSVATLIAVATARDYCKIDSRNIRTSVIYMTEQVHHCVDKSIRIAGLGECMIRRISTDEYFRMDVDKLSEQVHSDKTAGLNPFLIVASTGTTDTGAVDPLKAIADIARQHQIWYHVDAAYGGFFILTEELKARFAGIELADSVVIDPHKGLFLAYGTGAVLIKNVAALGKTHYYHANYMQDAKAKEGEPSPADLSPELTKHFRGLRMWLPLRLYGLDAYVAAITEKRYLCEYFYEEVQKIGFEVGPYPDLSVMIYRYIPRKSSLSPDQFNKQLVEAVKKDGRVFLSSTLIKGEFWLRLAVLCFRTRLSTIQNCLTVLKESVARLEETEVSEKLISRH